MTDRETIFSYRMRQTEETLVEARNAVSSAQEFVSAIKVLT